MIGLFINFLDPLICQPRVSMALWCSICLHIGVPSSKVWSIFPSWCIPASGYAPGICWVTHSAWRGVILLLLSFFTLVLIIIHIQHSFSTSSSPVWWI
ncbi:hypothetical protein J3R30DRAFT_3421656 [Lentinula aciculospora]|uniref:Uncharacterized protein n=1 Tax=Lentinula aciculospora TaxID=153920 RepID=A0A9W9AV63_9AGAR|nr:hypothetical protein J3R30DRAFT_3421656 [Lentinula aciculospora]